MSVTGRTYRFTRPRGLAEWAPNHKTLGLLAEVDAILADLADYLPMTKRQIFYRMVATRGYAKDELAYDRLCEMLQRAQRSGRISWDAIRDDGLTEITPGGFHGVPHFWDTVRFIADGYRRDPAPDQAVDVELWVEAAGMAPQVAVASQDYGVPVFSGGGFDGVAARHDAALRIIDRAREGRPTVVLRIGDLDPSGSSIIDSAADDIMKFCADYGLSGSAFLRFRNIAITEQQAELYQLETKPQKSTDRRGEYMDRTVQAEALDPPILAAVVRDAIEAELDLDVLARSRRAGIDERQRLLAELPDDEDGA